MALLIINFLIGSKWNATFHSACELVLNCKEWMATLSTTLLVISTVVHYAHLFFISGDCCTKYWNSLVSGAVAKHGLVKIDQFARFSGRDSSLLAKIPE